MGCITAADLLKTGNIQDHARSEQQKKKIKKMAVAQGLPCSSYAAALSILPEDERQNMC
jgi:hypothetical protein